MRFSVTIPAYKAAFISEAVHSVLAQRFQDFELLIVDDASPENIKDAIKQYLSNPKLHYYRNEVNTGALNVVDNWNRCLEYSSGEFIICMGDDDMLGEDCLYELNRIINQYPDLGLYHSRTQIIDDSGKVVQVLDELPSFENSLQLLSARWNGRIQFIGDFCFRTSELRRNGGFFKLPLAWGSDDISAYIAAKGQGKGLRDGVANTSKPVFNYRINVQSISSNNNYKTKLSSMMKAWDWFSREIESLHKTGALLSPDYYFFSSLCKKHFSEYPKAYVESDIKEKFVNVVYWIKHRKEVRLNLVQVLMCCCKSILK